MRSKNEARQIGDVAGETGFSIDTIRYYERLGLIEKPVRSEGGFRLYQAQSVEKLKFIQKAKSLGLTLLEIKQIIRQSERGLESCCRYVGDLVHKKLEDLETKINELKEMRRGLKGLLEKWVSLTEAKSRRFAVCPQIENERIRKKGGKENGKKKS